MQLSPPSNSLEVTTLPPTTRVRCLVSWRPVAFDGLLRSRPFDGQYFEARRLVHPRFDASAPSMPVRDAYDPPIVTQFKVTSQQEEP